MSTGPHGNLQTRPNLYVRPSDDLRIGPPLADAKVLMAAGSKAAELV
ncbi:MAG: hypothetical protein M3O41_08230 [Pseudomonadota bacterium]|nr:hypothetical protein [Pseudomonadota bacterium]